MLVDNHSTRNWNRQIVWLPHMMNNVNRPRMRIAMHLHIPQWEFRHGAPPILSSNWIIGRADVFMHSTHIHSFNRTHTHTHTYSFEFHKYIVSTTPCAQFARSRFIVNQYDETKVKRGSVSCFNRARPRRHLQGGWEGGRGWKKGGRPTHCRAHWCDVSTKLASPSLPHGVGVVVTTETAGATHTEKCQPYPLFLHLARSLSDAPTKPVLCIISCVSRTLSLSLWWLSADTWHAPHSSAHENRPIPIRVSSSTSPFLFDSRKATRRHMGIILRTAFRPPPDPLPIPRSLLYVSCRENTAEIWWPFSGKCMWAKRPSPPPRGWVCMLCEIICG